jgi:predicted TIM-barrel fold metal-dependent hydrolase
MHDADAHIMERADWLAAHADPNLRDRLPPYLKGDAEGSRTLAEAMRAHDRRRADAAERARAEAELMAMPRKGWHGLGAFDAQERTRALDLLGFETQLLFPTFAFNQFAFTPDEDVLIGGTRALNRGMAEYGQADARLRPVGFAPLRLGPERAGALIDEAFALGCKTVLVEMVAPDGARSFSHPDYDAVWARFAERRTPFVLHVGAEGAVRPVPLSFTNNGLPQRLRNDDAPRDAHALAAVGYAPMLFLSALVFDGVFARFPALRCGVTELGASWVPSFLRQLDHSLRAFRRLQPELAQLSELPSDTIRRRVKFTPYAGEDVGWLIEQGGDELFLFSSDYPHHEGTDDPVRRFDATLKTTPPAAVERFYSKNFEALFAGAERVVEAGEGADAASGYYR